MNPVVLCFFGILLALLISCGGCVRDEDRETGPAGGIFPEAPPELPTVPEPREAPTVPTLPQIRQGSFSGAQPSAAIIPEDHGREWWIHG
ncbi:MAG: hypothetical protein GKC05_02290 [Methanomicrobiales archaeon]|nr:hypothetical protein [Methanomicrobiales archaeon]NYT20210.1 hypothetical protein [Methanomicrobiales archaeon]